MRFRTKNNWYTLVDQGDGGFLISGNARYCPTPTPCTLGGPVKVGESVWFIPKGGRLTLTTIVEEIQGENPTQIH